MRKPMMAGNWKMNNKLPEAVVLTQELSNRLKRPALDKVDVVICPPFIDLKPALTVLDFDKVHIAVGAQNCYWEDKGAFTGEVSVPMLSDLGCEYCIVKHPSAVCCSARPTRMSTGRSRRSSPAT